MIKPLFLFFILLLLYVLSALESQEQRQYLRLTMGQIETNTVRQMASNSNSNITIISNQTSSLDLDAKNFTMEGAARQRHGVTCITPVVILSLLLLRGRFPLALGVH